MRQVHPHPLWLPWASPAAAGLRRLELLAHTSGFGAWCGFGKARQRGCPGQKERTRARLCSRRAAGSKRAVRRRCGADWGPQGGRTARELALWLQMQREMRARGLMLLEAEKRLSTIGVAWSPQVPPRHPRHPAPACVTPARPASLSRPVDLLNSLGALQR